MSTGSLERLIRMAEQIAANFGHAKNPAAATADHIAKFWDPRMKRMIFEHVAGGGTLSAVALEAIRELAADGPPPSQTPATEWNRVSEAGHSDAG